MIYEELLSKLDPSIICGSKIQMGLKFQVNIKSKEIEEIPSSLFKVVKIKAAQYLFICSENESSNEQGNSYKMLYRNYDGFLKFISYDDNK